MLARPKRPPRLPRGSAIDELKQRMDRGACRRCGRSTRRFPKPLDAVVTRCLDRDPAARYQTSAELVAALDRLDENGELIPIKRVVRHRDCWRPSSCWLLGAARRQLVVRAARWSRPRHRSGLGRDRRLSEQHRRSGVRPHAGADAQAWRWKARASSAPTTGAESAPRSACSRPRSSTKRPRVGSRRSRALGVVLSGSIDPSRQRLRISVKATQTVTGNVDRQCQAAERRARTRSSTRRRSW